MLIQTLPKPHSQTDVRHEMNWCDDESYSGSTTDTCQQDDVWSDSRITRLVCLYRKFPCLWKKDIASYIDNTMRHCAYSNIHRGMEIPGVTFTEVMMKIREVRRVYVCELKKLLEAQTSGRYYVPEFVWFAALHEYLYPYLDYDEAAELHNINCIMAPRFDADDEDYDDYSFSDLPSRCVKLQASRTTSPPAKNDYAFKFPHSDRCAVKKFYHCPSPVSSKKTEFCPSARIETRPVSFHLCPPQYDNCIKKTVIRPPRRFIATCEQPSKESSCVTNLDENQSDYECHSFGNQRESFSNYENPNQQACNETSSADRVNSVSSCATMSKACDEFDIFAKSVACQLRKMNTQSAVRAQNMIQKVLTDNRLHRLETTQPPVRPHTSVIKTSVQRKTSPHHRATPSSRSRQTRGTSSRSNTSGRSAGQTPRSTGLVQFDDRTNARMKFKRPINLPLPPSRRVKYNK